MTLCLKCGEKFKKVSSRQKYCSQKCQQLYYYAKNSEHIKKITLNRYHQKYRDDEACKKRRREYDKKYSKKYYAENKNEVLQYQKARRDNSPEVRAKQRVSWKKWYSNNRQEFHQRMKGQYNNNKDKWISRTKANYHKEKIMNAFRSQCCACSETKDLEMHHLDYEVNYNSEKDILLKMMLLCHKCHQKHHQKHKV